MFYEFKTGMERMEVLKEVSRTHKLPKDFGVEHAVTDLQENI